MKQKVGFIGLGLMGNPMAKNILKKGFPLTVYNRTQQKTKEIVSLGASVAYSPQKLASRVDVLITMITSGKDVKEVLFGENGVVKGANKGLIVIDMSTIGQSSAKEIGAELNKHNIEFLDAPVTGSVPKAITGELTIFVGGNKEILNKARPVLEAMGTHIVFMGKTGSGQAIKLINNYLLASNFIALSESMLLADGVGLPREKVIEALLKTPNLSPTVQMKLPNYRRDEYPLVFSLANMSKDLGLAVFEMKQIHKSLLGLLHADVVYREANKDRQLSREDFTAIIKEIEKK